MPRVPVIQQMSDTECGLACLAMVLGGLGRATSVRELRPAFGIGRDGTSARRMIEVARSYGLSARGLKIGPAQLEHVRLPAIAHWGQNHFTVVEKVGPRRVHVVDPASGRRKLATDDFFTEFTGTILEFDGGEDLVRRRRRLGEHLVVRFLADLVRLAPRWLTLVIVLSGVVQLLGLGSAWATKYGVDVVVGQHAAVLSTFVIGVVSYVLAQALATTSRGLVLLTLQRRLDGALGHRFMTHLIRLPYAYFQNRGAGDLMARLASNMAVREMLTSQLVTMILDSLFVVVYTALLIMVSPGYAAIVAGMGLVQLIIVISTFRPVHELAQRELSADAKAQSSAIDMLAGAEFLKGSGLADWALRRWTDRFSDSLDAAMRRRRLDTFNESAIGLFHAAAPLTLLVFGIIQVRAGSMSLGTMLALNVVAGLLLTPIGQLVGALRYLQTIGSHLERIYDVLSEQPEPGGSQATEPVALRGDIELRGISFRYDGNAPLVLDGVDLVAPAGSKVAVVGSTGSGKTTLVRLLTGLLRPTAGGVFVDGKPFDTYHLDGLRRRFGVVTQFPYIFGGSIRDNLTLGRGDVDDEALREALRVVQFLPDLERMPMGLDTIVGEAGSALSGGQRQRLAIARALLSQANVLVLDEATSNLDTLTEAAIAAELSALGCTRIVIAHRVSTVIDADQIVVLHQGRIIEQGTHDQLIALGGRYAALVSRQLPRTTAASG